MENHPALLISRSLRCLPAFLIQCQSHLKNGHDKGFISSHPPFPPLMLLNTQCINHPLVLWVGIDVVRCMIGKASQSPVTPLTAPSRYN